MCQSVCICGSCFPDKGKRVFSDRFHLFVGYYRETLVFQKEIGHRQGILFAIPDNAVQVVFLVIDPGYLATVDVVLGCGDIKKSAQKGKQRVFESPNFQS